MSLRHVFSWKPLFYEFAIPVLRSLGGERADELLRFLGQAISRFRPRLQRELTASLTAARSSLGADWDAKTVARRTAENLPRFLARDYPLDGLNDPECLSRFEVFGFEPVREALDQGRGVILVGGHFGAHVSALHWLYRRGVPLRLLVQRPKHISRELRRRFDSPTHPPQSRFFIRRGLPTSEAAERILRARAALLAGQAVYLNGDIPWSGPNTRQGRLFDESLSFLAIWADLAVLTGAPVSFVFASHIDGGRYRLRFDRPESLSAGCESAAVLRFLDRLREEIAENPHDAIPYLLWPCFRPAVPAPADESRPARSAKPPHARRTSSARPRR